MNSRRFTIASTLVGVVVVAAITYAVSPQAPNSDPALPPFEFHREGASNADDAATTLFRGVATGSPKHFVQHLLLGVCDGPIGTLQKFAECLHRTQFSRGDATFTFYDLPKGINTEKPIRVIASKDFDSSDKQVAALQFEGVSTYYGEKFMCIDVAAEGFDGLEYQTRIVVAQVNDRWYAMPRCRSAKSFYEIADAMHLTKSDEEQGKSMQVHYLEIVTTDVESACRLYSQMHGVTFGDVDQNLGGARTTRTAHGGLMGIRAPMHDGEKPVTRAYVLVDDIEAAVAAAERSGAEIALPPMKIAGHGTCAIYFQGGIEAGLWEL